MSDERGVTHYDQMPIPPVAAHTTLFEAGVIAIGVEYRLLDDAIAAASAIETASGRASGGLHFNDSGVSLHVFGGRGDDRLELIRFDCFDEDPHYHYVNWQARSNQMIHIDPAALGDPATWAIERIRSHLPEMLTRAGAGNIASSVDPSAVEAILPAVEEEAQRARHQHDPAAIRRAALGERQS